jgi:hypothetical protein
VGAPDRRVYPRDMSVSMSRITIEVTRVTIESSRAPADVRAALERLTPTVLVYETSEGLTRIEYDLPSSLIAQFGDAGLTEAAHALDVALARAFSAAAG